MYTRIYISYVTALWHGVVWKFYCPVSFSISWTSFSYIFLNNFSLKFKCLVNPDLGSCQLYQFVSSDLGSLKVPLSEGINKVVLIWYCKKCSLTKFNGKVHSLNYSMEGKYKGKLSYTRVRMICRETRDKRVRKTLPLSHKVQNGPPCFLNSFSERSLGVAGSRLRPNLINGLCLHDYIWIFH